jgi:threonine/homoserine/homoserine lactone efflux protein
MTERPGLGCALGALLGCLAWASLIVAGRWVLGLEPPMLPRLVGAMGAVAGLALMAASLVRVGRKPKGSAGDSAPEPRK